MNMSIDAFLLNMTNNVVNLIPSSVFRVVFLYSTVSQCNTIAATLIHPMTKTFFP